MPHETRRIPLSQPFGRQVGSRFSFRGPFLSAVVHVAIVLALLYGAQRGSEALAAGQGPGRGGGGGGGGNRQFTVIMQAPAAAKAAPAPVVPPPEETPRLVVPKVVQPLDSIVPPSTNAAAAPQAATGPGSGAGAGPGSGTGSGGGTGSGQGTGTGSGVGPDSGGAGGNIIPPQPSTIVPPPFENVPRELRGVRIAVKFDISDTGEILGIDVDPPIRDRGFRNQFMDRIRRYVFTAAVDRSGRRVRASVTLMFTLPTH